ncbi:MAG: ankyrin repeat domain-containing protein [Candidatus Dependentiae bacterium]
MQMRKISILILFFLSYLPSHLDATSSMNLSVADRKLLRKALNVEMHGGAATFYGSKSDEDLNALIEKARKASNNPFVISFFSAEYNKTDNKIKQLLKQIRERSEQIIDSRRTNAAKKQQLQAETKQAAVKLSRRRKKGKKSAAVSLNMSVADQKLLRKAFNSVINNSTTFFTVKSDGDLNILIEKCQKVLNNLDAINFFSAEYNKTDDEIKRLLRQSIKRSERIINSRQVAKKQQLSDNQIIQIKSVDGELFKNAFKVQIYGGVESFFASKSDVELNKVIRMSRQALNNDKLIKQLTVQFKKTVAEIKRLLNKSIDDSKKEIVRRLVTSKPADKENNLNSANLIPSDVQSKKSRTRTKMTMLTSKNLLNASENGDLKGVKWYIDKGGDLNQVNTNGLTALALAANKGHSDIVSALIKAGADLDRSNKSGHTPMVLALFAKHFDIVKQLITVGADVNIKDQNGWNVLMHAVRRGYIPVVDDLLEERKRILSKINEGSIENTIYSSTRMLIDVEAGANVQSPLILLPISKGDWKTAIWNIMINAFGGGIGSEELTVNQKKEKVGSLIKKEEPQKIISDTKGLVFEEQVEVSGQKDPIEKLKRNVQLNAVKIMQAPKIYKTLIDINAQNNDGETALIIATRWNYADIAKKIIRAGADVNIAQNTGLTPLHEVVINGNVDLAKILLDEGADINVRDTYRGRTPLHWVTRITVGAPKKKLNQISVATSVKLVRLLLSRGADPMIKDFQGKTALQWARKINAKPLIDILQKARARRKKVAYNQNNFDMNNLFNFGLNSFKMMFA